MRKTSYLSASFVAACLLGHAGAALAETCYAVGGTVNTMNTGPITQQGTITLVLSNSQGKAVLNETGSLHGIITGTGTFGQQILSHTADLTRGGFVTTGDEAFITGVRAIDNQDPPMPCSYFVTETITNIASGSAYFSDVTSVNIVAQGYISFCPGENENAFDLSGQLCRSD